MTTLPAFRLRDDHGHLHCFPGRRVAVICFVKQDCPTCNEVMGVLEALWRSFHEVLDMHVVGQTTEGNRLLTQQHDPGFALLDDSALRVSFSFGVDVVPTVVLANEDGTEATRLQGFVRNEWRSLASQLSRRFAVANAAVDWRRLPEWRPGCGSLSGDPVTANRLDAETGNSRLLTRPIEIGRDDDVFEFMFDQGFSDGLPLIPPTPERVLGMLSGTSRDFREVVGTVAPNMGEATVEKIAINAVMAGCRPEYLPAVIAAVEAACDEAFNVHGVMATTMGASPVVIVNGPIRHRLKMNMKLGALGQGCRASATIGRALRLVIRNVGGARPGETERSTLGNPMKFTMCFAEWEERNPWSPLHVERGFEADDSVVTLFAMTSGPTLIVDQDSRTAAQVAGSMGLCLESAFHPKAHYATEVLLVLCPEHVDTLVRGGYSKADIRARIQEVSARPVRDLMADQRSGVGFRQEVVDRMSSEELDRLLPKFRRDEDIHLVVAGADAGKFSGAFHGWLTGDAGSVSVSRAIEEAA